MKDEDINKVFLFETKYFTDPGFNDRFNYDIKRLRAFIRYGNDRESSKDTLNAFMKACFASITDEDTRIHMHLEFYLTLAHYAEINDSHQTFENIISDFDKPELRSKLFGKLPMQSYLVYGEALLKYYGLRNEESRGWYTEQGFDLITKAKYYIVKAYNQFLEGKNKFNDSDQSYCFVLLAACHMHLSRWFEPVFYLEQLKAKDLNDPNYDYLTALNLDALMEKSCLDYNGQLLLRIIECGTNVINNPSTEDRQKQSAKELVSKCSDNIARAKLSIEKLKKHKNKIESTKKKRNPYFNFCIDSQLFLNEHALFCKCGRSVGDTLEIRTQHKHTQLEWVYKFERLLELLIADFELARANLYQATSPNKLKFHYKSENKKRFALQLKKDSLLKNTFKICYSLLDQIAHGIFEVLEIDIQNYLKTKSITEGKPIQHLYFLNMWELYNFTEDDFKNNLYLISLFSIAKDLDRTEYAPLKAFKDYRNAMEHKFLFIEGPEMESPPNLMTAKRIKRSELIVKTKLLTTLTKSAILSFTYLVRRQSKIKEIMIKKSASQ